MHGAEHLPAIVDFLNRIGVPVQLGPFGPDGFLPGVTVCQGSLRVDPDHLVAAGDLLHEAGHIAIVPRPLRPHLGNDLEATLLTAAEQAGGGGPELDMILRLTEPMAIAWSYAALLAADLPPDCVFFPASYNLFGADPAALLALLRSGNSYGVDGLARLGMTGNAGIHRLLYDNGLPPFPHMTGWLNG